MSDSLIDKIIQLLSNLNETIYGGRLTQLQFANLYVGNVWGEEFYWENNANEGIVNEEAGSAMTAALLHRYHNDSKMIYAIWASAVAFSIVNSTKQLPEDWRGEPFKFLEDLEIKLIQRYSHELQYHHACTNVLPIDLQRHIYKPATKPYDFVGIIANLAHHTLTLWTPVHRITE